MTHSRRDFFKQTSILTGAGALGLFAESIKRALAIEPQAGTTFLDAERIENGAWGFSDPLIGSR